MEKRTESFGEVVARLRKEKDFGLRELARKLGISPTYLSKIENGILPPPADDKIESLARLLEVSADELFTAAKRIPTDVKNMIDQRPEMVTLLLREAKEISDEEIRRRLRERTEGKS